MRNQKEKKLDYISLSSEGLILSSAELLHVARSLSRLLQIKLRTISLTMMINFMILFLGLFWLQETVQAQDFQPPVQENAFSELLRLEEKLLPELDAFVAKKEDYLKELDKIIHQTEILKKPSIKSVQSFLGTPLNQYFLIKRFIDNWGTLDDYLQSDISTHDFVSQIKLKKDAIPAKAKLNERLRVLEDTHNIDPEGYRVSL
ncbi:hypothetical protein pdam_00012273 [Pocillopora damicornis]|uniref:Prolyl 4-hydroxylase N-terminal domain-containing protein n=2 Tax=Pocillopora damicornis TaxID=46731 RepID=A0A3M6TJG3_POCDA|nr:hypothetical protein pdam_00012273 [Pocillopora damicornis]